MQVKKIFVAVENKPCSLVCVTLMIKTDTPEPTREELDKLEHALRTLLNGAIVKETQE